jgi:hypothetical protein
LDAKQSGFLKLAVGGCFVTCLLTLLIWFFAVVAIYGVAAGDCFPALSSNCPSDHDRNVRMVLIALGALGINVLAIVFVGRALARNLDTKD